MGWGFPRPVEYPSMSHNRNRKKLMKAPPISKDLIEYLEKVFPVALIAASPSAQPHEITATVHQEVGKQIVVRHLRAFYEEQQNEDPLHVYEDPENP